jgi:uncharacterized protein (DUF305 family)
MSAVIERDDVLDAGDYEDDGSAPPVQSRALRLVLLSIIAIAVLVMAGTAGFVLRGSGGTTPPPPPTNSVDAGFARDMSTHHTQAVTMAGYERDNTTNPSMKLLAFDIETEQEFQVGQMQGWLDSWGLSRNAPTEMAWMGGHTALPANALMPGMATPAQMTLLEKSHGKALDILFLQLMIHHHQGGLEMAQYAEQHAVEPYVAQLATDMYAQQSGELITMEQALRKLGGQALPAPAN